MTDRDPSLAARHRTVWWALTTCIAVLVLAASSVVAGIPPSQAGTKTSLAATESSPWPQTNGNAAQSRVNLNEKVLTPSAVTKVRYLRQMVAPKSPVNPDCGPDGIVAPVLAGGYVYAMTNQKLSKYNAATGRLIWRTTPDPTFITYYFSLAVSGNLVIVGGAVDWCITESEVGGAIFAFNASTGALVWTATRPAETGLSGAVVSGSYVVTDGSSGGQEVAVFNLSDGTPVWSHSGCGGGLPLVVARLVVSYGCDSQVSIEADNLATGATVWSLPGWQLQRGDLNSSAGTHLYATNPSGTVVDLNPQTGQVSYSLSQAVTVLAVGRYRLYATCGSAGQDICAYNTSTGALEWQDTQFAAPSLVAEAAGVLYLDSGIALNAGTGQYITQIWQAPNKATAIAVGDGRIAVVSDPRILDLYGLPGY
jgi:outer membrane protein assembly factor BamB